ncbi:MAG: hypothetical protein EXQ92_08430 [Alphaproteobacteria bacterium]|nr:hypothetical protein [Alphaproteobacteria bacterium]
MNLQRGLWRVWALASAVWIVAVILRRAPNLTGKMTAEEFLGPSEFPWWPSLLVFVDAHFRAEPSGAMIAARVGDALIEMATLPLAVLGVALAVRWVSAGFRSN